MAKTDYEDNAINLSVINLLCLQSAFSLFGLAYGWPFCLVIGCAKIHLFFLQNNIFSFPLCQILFLLYEMSKCDHRVTVKLFCRRRKIRPMVLCCSVICSRHEKKWGKFEGKEIF